MVHMLDLVAISSTVENFYEYVPRVAVAVYSPGSTGPWVHHSPLFVSRSLPIYELASNDHLLVVHHHRPEAAQVGTNLC